MKTITEGKIVKLVRHRGFGFIQTDEPDFDSDVFFHHSVLENAYFEDLSVGDELEFEINTTDKGPEATKVTKVVDNNLDTEFDGEVTDEPASENTLDEHLGW